MAIVKYYVTTVNILREAFYLAVGIVGCAPDVETGSVAATVTRRLGYDPNGVVAGGGSDQVVSRLGPVYVVNAPRMGPA